MRRYVALGDRGIPYGSIQVTGKIAVQADTWIWIYIHGIFFFASCQNEKEEYGRTDRMEKEPGH